MIDVKTLKKGDKVRIIDNQDNNVFIFKEVNLGDIAEVVVKTHDKIKLSHENWRTYIWFKPEQLEYLVNHEKYNDVRKFNYVKLGKISNIASKPQQQDVVIFKSRWDELVNKLTSECSSIVGMTDDEAEIVRSVLKDNTPFCVVDDPIDPIINKEEQTHLDATHVGDTGNCALYYKSEILKKWFWWNDEYTWEECYFKYGDEVPDLFPITISKSI